MAQNEYLSVITVLELRSVALNFRHIEHHCVTYVGLD